MRAYGQIHASFWTSATIRGLTEDGRTLAAYLLTSPHTTMIGCFRLSDGYACDDLGWGIDRVSKAFADLDAAGFAKRTTATQWVLIANFLKWSPVKGPKQAAGALKLLKQVPRDEPLLVELEAAIRSFSPDVKIPDRKAIDRVSEPYRLQEQEQEQEYSEPKGSDAAASPAPPSVDPADPEYWRKMLFKDGRLTLMRISGKNDSSARTMIGKWLRDAREDARRVLRAIEDAEVEHNADPVAWITAALAHRARPASDAMTMMRQRH